jgi:F0F1-type ATP synthase membrane subunit b/b'
VRSLPASPRCWRAVRLLAKPKGRAACRSSTITSFAPQLVWLAIAFVVLYLVMSRLAIPAISDTIDKRQGKIQGDLDAAEKANEDTRGLVTAYEKRLADTREDARKLMRERGGGRQHRGRGAAAPSPARQARTARIGEAEKRIAAQRDDVMRGPRGHGARTSPPGRLQPSSPASRPTGRRSPPRSRRQKEAADGSRTADMGG